MVRIAISQAAFDAIAKTLPHASVGYENETNEKGERLIWLDRAVVDRLRAMRGPGESYFAPISRNRRRSLRLRSAHVLRRHGITQTCATWPCS